MRLSVGKARNGAVLQVASRRRGQGQVTYGALFGAEGPKLNSPLENSNYLNQSALNLLHTLSKPLVP
jgi:hypothetical protein